MANGFRYLQPFDKQYERIRKTSRSERRGHIAKIKILRDRNSKHIHTVYFGQKCHKTFGIITVTVKWTCKISGGWLFRWRAVRSWRSKARRKRQKNRISMPAVEAEAACREHRAQSARAPRAHTRPRQHARLADPQHAPRAAAPTLKSWLKPTRWAN